MAIPLKNKKGNLNWVLMNWKLLRKTVAQKILEKQNESGDGKPVCFIHKP
jgi:hypothetical protein